MNSKKLCIEILTAESEEKVQAIIKRTPKMRDSENWVPLDKRDTNFNVVTNQAMTGAKAATELMTNMVDALLMKHAYIKGIDPQDKGEDVPRTIYEAVDKLINNLYGGKLVKADESWLRPYSEENLVIGITGSRSTKGTDAPCFTFADNGEGQDPERFEDTFLSLSKGTKKDIPFVQGRFNMGSSGVLSFCGNYWFKLIVSRRYDKKGKWGWTLIRRRPGASVPIADYFKPDGKIPSFEAKRIFPFSKKDGSRFDGFHLSSGSIIKLYDLFLGGGHRGFSGVRDAFNENLVESILPFRIYDFRHNPSSSGTAKGKLRTQGIDARPFYGMEYLLLRSHAEEEQEHEPASETENKLTVAVIKDPRLGKIHITAIPLKKKIPGWLQPQKSNSRIFHTVNGQVQSKQTRGFLSQCGYPALKDRVVIIADASDLTSEAHNDVWKGDREHIRETHTGDHYKSVVRDALKKSDVLKDLQQKIAREELTQSVKKETADIFQKLVDRDRNIADLLNNRNPSIILNSSKPDEDEYEGKFNPTFLELEGKFRNGNIEIPINGSRPVAARTDVANNYFHRPDTTGHLYISDDEIEKRFRVGRSLKDGRLTVYFALHADTDIDPGVSFFFDMGLQDPSMPLPLKVPITLIVTEEGGKPKKPKKRKKRKNRKEDEKPEKSLPKYKLLTKDGRQIEGEDCEQWPEDFNDFDGGIVEDFGEEGIIYKINYDNAFHLKYRQSERGKLERDSLTQKYILGMRLLMLGFEHAVKEKQNASDDGSFEELKDDFRKIAARGAASTVLALAEGLPKLMGMADDEPE